MYENILRKIEEYNKISIFRHVRPDGDATFSSFGLYSFIKDNYPDKKIKLAGFEKYDLISKNDKVSDKFIKESLVLVCDTATRQRADDQRFLNGSYIIKIDHHPDTDNYANDSYVETSATSTCELVAKILFSKAFKDKVISEKTCEYLYCGMVTDSLNFRIPVTSYKTLEIASKLCKQGKLIVGDLVSYVSDTDTKTYKLITNIRSKLQINNKFGYVLLTQDELKDMGVSSDEAKNHIAELTTISDINIFAFAVENSSGLYDCSYRSKRTYVINDVAYNYGGGGHANACATRNLSLMQQNAIFDILVERSTR